MKVRINKRFFNDLARLPTNDRNRIEGFVFEEIEKFDTLESTVVFEKLKGFHNYYKVRFGQYRVGSRYEDGILTFERVLHCKEIYKYFP